MKLNYLNAVLQPLLTCICENECWPMFKCELNPYSRSVASKSCGFVSESSSAIENKSQINVESTETRWKLEHYYQTGMNHLSFLFVQFRPTFDLKKKCDKQEALYVSSTAVKWFGNGHIVATIALNATGSNVWQRYRENDRNLTLFWLFHLCLRDRWNDIRVLCRRFDTETFAIVLTCVPLWLNYVRLWMWRVTVTTKQT